MKQNRGWKRVAALVAASTGLVASAAFGETSLGTVTPMDGGWTRTIETDSGTDVVLCYTNTAAAGFTWTVPANVYYIDYLVVGGGGAGGSNSRGCGGGAGGGVKANSSCLVFPDDVLSIHVGKGGAAGTRQGNAGGASSLYNGDCEFAIALGGGGGGNGAGDYAATSGANGGGGRVNCSGAAGMDGGYAGGNGGSKTGGGGGGAGGVGGNGSGSSTGAGGTGGLGVASLITGEEIRYAGGGGGGGADGSTKIGVGKDGGGDGSRDSTSSWATAGVDGLGGGGGGDGHNSGGSGKAGKGGCGTVIIRYCATAAQPDLYDLSYSVAPAGAGTIASNVRAGDVPEGYQVSLTATANVGYGFVGWTTNGVPAGAEAELSFPIAFDTAAVANFVELPPVVLTVVNNEAKQTYVAITNNAPVTGSTVVSNLSVMVVATPTAEYRYYQIPDGWTAGAVSGTIAREFTADTDPTVITIPDAVDVINYSLTITAPEHGSIIGAESGLCEFGTQLSLVAMPATGYRFTGWTVNGTDAGRGNPLVITVNGDTTVAAAFVETSIPSRYVPVDYISSTSTGKQYIDTGIGMQDKFRVEMEFKWNTFPNSSVYMMGAYYSSGGTTYRQYAVNVSNGKWRAGVNGNYTHEFFGGENTAQTGVRYSTETLFNGTTCSFTVNGNTESYTGSTATARPSTHFMLFNYTTSTTYVGDATLYSCQMYTNATSSTSGVLARDYLPVYDFTTTKYGLYDLVTDTFSPSAYGSFTGPAVQVPVVVSVDGDKVDYTATAGGSAIGTTVAAGASITVVATPKYGFEYETIPEGWIEAATEGTITRVFTVNESPFTFEIPDPVQIIFHQLTIAQPVNGAITGASTAELREGTVVTLTEIPDDDYHFVGWTTNGVPAGTESTLSFALDSDVAVEASFERNPHDGIAISSNYPVSAFADGGIPAYGEHPEDSVPGTRYTYTCPATVAIGSDGNARARCSGWKLYDIDNNLLRSSTDGGEQATTMSLEYDGNGKQLVWEWVIEYLVSSPAVSHVTVDGAGWYAEGDTVTLTGTADSGYYVDYWTRGFVRSSANPLVFTMGAAPETATPTVAEAVPYVLADCIRFSSFCGKPLVGDDGSGEYFVLTNLSATARVELGGVRVVFQKMKTNKSGVRSADGNPKCDIVIPTGIFVPPLGSVRFAHDDFATGWEKITNGDLDLFIYDTDGVTLVQKSSVNQDAFPSVNDAGAALMATAFEAVTTKDDWKPSFSAAAAFVRFCAFNGMPAVNTDANEWVMFTNLYKKSEIDLTGLRFVIGKKKDIKDDPSQSNCDFKFKNVLGSQVVGSNACLRVDQSAVKKGWKKISNGDLLFFLFDADGSIIQEGEITQSAYPNYYNNDLGSDVYLYATSTGKKLQTTDWYESGTAPEPDPEDDPTHYATSVSPVMAADGAALTSLALDLSGSTAAGDVHIAWARVNRGGAIDDWAGHASVGTVAAADDALALTRPAGYDLADSDWRVVKFFITTDGGITFTELSPAYRLDGIDWESADGTRQLGDVILSEFQAKNESTLKTKCGLKECDWVELQNRSAFPVDISGWAITDSPTDLAGAKFPSGTIVGAFETMVAFCSKDAVSCDRGDVHLKIGLSSSAGEYVGLVNSRSEIVNGFTYPAQFKDVSYGVGHSETVLETTAPKYRVGVSGAWLDTLGGIGMTTNSAFFAMRYWGAGKTVIQNFDAALNYIQNNDPVAAYSVKTISFVHSASNQNGNPVNEKGKHIGLAQGGEPYSGISIDAFDAVLNIPEAGDWTFVVSNSAYTSHGLLGARFELSRNNIVLALEDDDNEKISSGNGSTYKVLRGTFRIPEAGGYKLSLVYCGGNNGSPNRFLLYAGKNDEANPGQVTLQLVNSTSAGALKLVGKSATEYATDVRSAMLNQSLKAQWKTTFTLDGAPSADEIYYVKARYADGISVAVNGTTIKTVPALKRTTDEALCWSVFRVPSDVLRPGVNEVVLTGENDAIGDCEFLLNAIVVKTRSTDEVVYFPEPTPWAPNTTVGKSAPTKKVCFSEPHGYKTEPFTLTMSCDDPLAEIYYTTNGVSPSIATGVRYTGPITISSTTCIRAAVPNPTSIFQDDSSATYLFLSDILAQPRYSSGTLPDFYGSKGFIASGNGRADLENGTQRMRYGFNQNVLAQDGAIDRVMAGMTNGIDTISLVIDPKSLFDDTIGIYSRAMFHGRAWERQTMIEAICPTNSANDFTLGAGLRIRGGSSRQVDHPKHSFRFYFRSDYGASSLKAKIFGDEGADEFGKLDLRTSQNWSLANENSRHDTFIHETFLRDTQRDLGEPYTRSRYYHLYINGIYWGLYETQERVDEDYAASYLGRDADDYDVIKRSMQYKANGAVDDVGWETAAGSTAAYRAMGVLAKSGFETDEKLLKAVGLNADGTRNPNYPIYVNRENLMKFVLINHYTCNIDSPFAGSLNNLYAVRGRTDDETGKAVNGFVFLCHDGEHSMGTDTTIDSHRTDDSADWRKVKCHYTNTVMSAKATGDAYDVPASSELGLFGPAQLHFKLMQNAEYRMAFADFVYRTCFKEGGELTVPVAKARFESRMDEIDDAIMGEIARWDWSDTKLPLPNHGTWTNACGECLEFIEKRLPYLIQDYRQAGWYPTNEAPVVTANGDELTIAAASGATIYYTTDGSDPRATGGTAQGTVYDGALTIPEEGIAIKVRSLSSDGEWSPLEEFESAPVGPELPQFRNVIRIHSFDGVTADGLSGDTHEWIVLTNLTDATGYDLAGAKLVVLKDGDPYADAKCVINLTEGMTISAGGSVKLEQDVLGWNKITNGKIHLYLYRRDGETLMQHLYVNQKDFVTYYGQAGDKGPGGETYLRALSYDEEDVGFEEVAYDNDDPTEDIPEDATLIEGVQDEHGPYVLTEGLYYLRNAEFPAGVEVVGDVTLHLMAGTHNTALNVLSPVNDIAIEGTGQLKLEGTNTLMTVKELTVTDGELKFDFAGATVDGAYAVQLFGNYIQEGGEVTMDVTSDVCAYGFLIDTKNCFADFRGGKFYSKIKGGEKSATFQMKKGSNNCYFNGTEIEVKLGGTSPRFVKTDGSIEFREGTYAIVVENTTNGGSDSRAFSAVKDIVVDGGTLTAELTKSGSEIFSADGSVIVNGGTLSMIADDDCISAGEHIVVNSGKVHAVSRSSDALDSNGDMTLAGGYVFAFTSSSSHEALDVDPSSDSEGAVTDHKLVISNGVTLVAVGGKASTPDVSSTATCYAAGNQSSSELYFEFDQVENGDSLKTTTVWTVNWDGRHPSAFSVLATASGFDGVTVRTHSTKPTDAYPETAAKLDDAVPGVFLRKVIGEFDPSEIIVKPGQAAAVVEAADAAAAIAAVTLAVDVPAVEGLTEAVYKGYFMLVAEPVAGQLGQFAVSAVIDPDKVPAPVVGSVAGAEPIAVNGFTATLGVVNAKPGLWYGFEATEDLTTDFLLLPQSFVQAQGETLVLAVTKPDARLEFFRIVVRVGRPSED